MEVTGPTAGRAVQQSPAIRLKTRVPRLSARLVDRGRLRAVLDDEGSPANVVVVTGPPGAGKTTLLADWARRVGDVAWVTLDEGDGVTDVWDALVAAVGRLAEPGPGAGLRRPADGVGPAFVAAVLDTLSRLDRRVRLIVDEVEHLVDPEAVRTVDLLLRWAPASLQIVLAGRMEPPLALGRLRVAGLLRELRARDLLFTPDEASELLAAQGLVLDTPRLEALVRYTEGWAAGLRLVAMSLESATDHDAVLSDLAGAQPEVADYLVGELLARQDAAVIDFLLRTSVCDQLTPELSVELSGREDAGELLENLCRANALTLRLGGSRPHYRYHRMLRGYLQAELARRRASAAADLHRRAAAWYAARDDVRRGIAHAAAAGDAERVTELVDRGGLGLVLSGEAQTVERLLAGAPADVLARPSVALVAAAAALERGDVDRGDALLREAGRTPGDRRAATLLAALRLQLGNQGRGTVEPLDQLDAVETTGDADVDMLMLLARGGTRLRVGDVRRAEEDLRHARDLAAVGRRDHVVVRCLATLAWAAVGHDLGEAAERAGAALGFAADRGWEGAPSAGRAQLAAGFVAYLRLDDPAAERGLRTAEEVFDGGADPAAQFAASMLHAVAVLDGPGAEGRADRRRRVATLRCACAEFSGPLEPAVVAITAGALQRACLDLGEYGWADEGVDWAVERLGTTAEANLLHAVARVHRGRADVARRLVATVVDGTPPCASPLTLIEAWLLEAVLADMAGRSVRSHAALSTAVRLAEPAGLARPFQHGGQAVRALLSRHCGRFGRGEPFVRRLLGASPSAGFGPTERLSEREMEILLELPSLRTAEEIAADLGVSVNTVKTHMRAVYRKLQVGSRRDAVAAGRRHALL